MQIDKELVNRALLKAGQTPLTDDDINNNAEMWKTCKAFYLSTILETLARTPWTSAKKRTILERIPENENYSPHSYGYSLPVDCSRALKLNSNLNFIIEGEYLYTDDPIPILLYITNGRIKDEPVEEVPPVEEPEEPTEEPVEPVEEVTDPLEIPGYETLTYDPNFWEYIETRLASKIVLKITGDMSLYNLLFGESQIIEQTAAKTSKASGKSKPSGQAYWTDEVVGASRNVNH